MSVMLSIEARANKWAKEWRSLPLVEREAIAAALPDDLRLELEGICNELYEAEFRTNDQQFHIYSGWLAAIVEQAAKGTGLEPVNQRKLRANARTSILSGHEALLKDKVREASQSPFDGLIQQLRYWFQKL